MSDVMRIVEGTGRPHEAFWRIRDAVEQEGGDPEMELYGPISEYSWYGDEITPKLFKDDLYKAGKGGPVTVHINSTGGDVLAASVIKATLLAYPGKVTAVIDGLAASAATIVTTGADVVRMNESAYYMIHDPSTVAWGTIDEIKKTLDVLKTVKDGLVDAYQTRTKLPADKLAKMLTDETWMTAREAQELGFVDEVIATPKAKTGVRNVQQMAAVTNMLRTANFINLPAELRARLEQPVRLEDEPGEPDVNQQVAARLRAEIQILR